MLTINDLTTAFTTLGLQNKAVIAHASLSTFGPVEGGAETFVASLARTTGAIIMPTHTYKTMVTPSTGPANNAINYTRGQPWNRLAVPFRLDMPADSLMGAVPEMLRKWPGAQRSNHPILSFAGLGVDAILDSQTIAEPFAPVEKIANMDGWVLLLGVNHTTNTSMHYAEKLAGRNQFTRWAMTEAGVTACPGFPGCSVGFNAIEAEVQIFTKTITVGQAIVRALPLRGLIVRVIEMIKKDRHALLCMNNDCERCAECRRF
jgi:aminoglycoside 3-N-acetyltransferase